MMSLSFQCVKACWTVERLDSLVLTVARCGCTLATLMQLGSVKGTKLHMRPPLEVAKTNVQRVADGADGFTLRSSMCTWDKKVAEFVIVVRQYAATWFALF